MVGELSECCASEEDKQEHRSSIDIMHKLLLLILVLLGTTALVPASAALSERACRKERNLGVNACKEVLFGKEPSPQCCTQGLKSHVECICPIITRKLAALIDVSRAIRLIEGCGLRVPRHFKCGSITTP